MTGTTAKGLEGEETRHNHAEIIPEMLSFKTSQLSLRALKRRMNRNCTIKKRIRVSKLANINTALLPLRSRNSIFV
jgi:hypothetical protein